MEYKPTPKFQAHVDTSLESKVAKEIQQSFAQRYPGSIEHCLRLLTERLQLGLDKRGISDLTDVGSWKISPQDLLALSQSLELLDQIHRRNTKE